MCRVIMADVMLMALLIAMTVQMEISCEEDTSTSNANDSLLTRRQDSHTSNRQSQIVSV